MDIKRARKRMQKSLDFLKNELVKIRGSRANPELLEDIKVEVYGSSLPIKQLGTVNVVDPTLITVSCWDKNNAEVIKRAIEESELNVNTSVDGNIIRVPLPSLSQERREELIKVVKKLAEDAKIAIRSIRRDLIDMLDKEQTSEDEKERGKKEIQKLVNEFNTTIEEEFEEKKEELLTI